MVRNYREKSNYYKRKVIRNFFVIIQIIKQYIVKCLLMSPDPLSEEDKKAFQEAMQGVTRLRSPKTRVDLNAEKKPESMAKRKESVNIRIKPIPALSDFVAEQLTSEAILSYHALIVPHRRFNELKNGKIAYESRLDLHRKTVEEARMALCQFIEKSQQSKQSCVLIIHGKGHNTGDYPVLKNVVAVWLKQLPEVIAYHSALPRHGGAGALYVLLSSNKK